MEHPPDTEKTHRNQFPLQPSECNKVMLSVCVLLVLLVLLAADFAGMLHIERMPCLAQISHAMTVLV
jgi:hypothetical protein